MSDLTALIASHRAMAQALSDQADFVAEMAGAPASCRNAALYLTALGAAHRNAADALEAQRTAETTAMQEARDKASIPACPYCHRRVGPGQALHVPGEYTCPGCRQISTVFDRGHGVGLAKRSPPFVVSEAPNMTDHEALERFGPCPRCRTPVEWVTDDRDGKTEPADCFGCGAELKLQSLLGSARLVAIDKREWLPRGVGDGS